MCLVSSNRQHAGECCFLLFDMKDWSLHQTHQFLTLTHAQLLYRVSHELRSLLRESVPYVKIYRYNPKHLYPKLNGYGDNGKFESMAAVTHLLIAKFILKLAGICGFCNVNICT